MSQKKHIDRLFQEKFKDFEAEPDQNIWKNIELELKKNKPSKSKKIIPFWLRVSAIAASLIVLLTSGFLILNTYNINFLPIVKKDSSTVNKENTNNHNDINNTTEKFTVNTPSKDKTLNENEKGLNQNIESDASQISVSDNSSSSKTSSNTSGEERLLVVSSNKEHHVTANKTSLNSDKSETNPIITQNKTNLKLKEKVITLTTKVNSNTTKEALSYSQQNRSQTQETTETSNGVNPLKTNTSSTYLQTSGSSLVNKNKVSKSNSSNNLNNTNYSKNKSNDKTNSNNFSEDTAYNLEETLASNVYGFVKPLVVLKSDSISNYQIIIRDAKSIEAAIEESKRILEKEKRGLKWTVSTNIAPVYYNSFGDGSQFGSQFSNNNKTGEINTSYGISVGYSFNDKFKIRSGINKLNLSYDTDDVIVFESISNSKPDSFLNVDFYSSINNQEITVISANNFPLQQIDSEISYSAALSQRISYLEVPLELEYTLRNKKLGLSVIGGFSTFLLENNLVVSEFDDYKIDIGEANNINNISFSTNIGLGINYKFNKSFIYIFEPTLKYQINGFSNTSGDFNPYIIGVYTGFSYKF